MTDSERDKLILEIHANSQQSCAAIRGMKRDLEGNGQPGIKKRLAVVEVRQRECPARLSTTQGGMMLKVAVLALVVSMISAFAVALPIIRKVLK